MPQRSPREWAVRGALAAAALVLGGFSVAHTLAQVVVKDNPELAHRLAPWDGRITAALAASLVKLDASQTDRRRADALAREALRQDPTAVAAVSTLGINAQLRGDVDSARRLFTYSQKLSRRDLQTQLWMIEDAVGRGDIAGALHHYDIALRAKGQSWELLFPILAGASADARVRTELVRTLAAKPLWSEHFISYVAGNPADPRAVSTLFLDLRRARVPVAENAHVAAINALLGGNFTAEAWRHYTAIRPGADPRRSRDPRFTASAEYPTAFDWAPINESGVNTSIQRGEQGGIFDFSSPPSIGGPLLQQMQMLPPGKYRIVGHSTGIDQDAASLPHWALLCRSDGRELGRVTLTNSSQADGNFSGELTVPAGCPVQILMLVARASDKPSGLVGQIDRAQLAPAP